MCYHIVEKALEEIKLYVERYGTFAQKDEDELEKLYQQVENQNLKRDLDFKKLEPLLQSYEETIAELKHLVILIYSIGFHVHKGSWQFGTQSYQIC